MSDDNVIDFSQRREVIPVNLPDIGVPAAVECMGCKAMGQWRLLALPEQPIRHVECANCGHLHELTESTLIGQLIYER